MNYHQGQWGGPGGAFGGKIETGGYAGSRGGGYSGSGGGGYAGSRGVGGGRRGGRPRSLGVGY